MLLKSCAKVNLALDILGKDPVSSFHFLKTVLYEIEDFFDEIELKTKGNFSTEILCDNKEVPTDNTNTMFKATNILQNKFNIKQGVQIKIKKNIPMGGGLGGGSSNGASILIALNKLWNLDLNNDELRFLAKKIGMDAPFFIEGGVALGENFGEKITIINNAPKLNLEILNFPKISIDTPWAYKNIDDYEVGKDVSKTENLIFALEKNDLAHIKENIHNDFEDLIYDNFPEIKEKVDEILKIGKKVCLTGSGSCMFVVR